MTQTCIACERCHHLDGPGPVFIASSVRGQGPNHHRVVFHHLHRGRRYQPGERIGNLLHSFQNAAERAKLPADLRPYDLRHTRITKWVGAGHNLALVQKAAGHSTVRTTMGYVHLVDDDLSALVAAPAQLATEVVDLKERLARAG